MAKMELLDKVTTIELVAKMVRSGEKVTAMSVATKFKDHTGKRIDWHEFSDYLDQLRTKKFLKCIGFDASSATIYTIDY